MELNDNFTNFTDLAEHEQIINVSIKLYYFI